MSAKVVSCSNINGYLRNYQDCLTLSTTNLFTQYGQNFITLLILYYNDIRVVHL
jgi:hypothetical protein